MAKAKANVDRKNWPILWYSQTLCKCLQNFHLYGENL